MRQEFYRSKGNLPDEKQLNRAVAKLIKDNGAKMNQALASKVRTNVEGIYKELRKENLDIGKVEDMLYDASAAIVDNISILHDEAWTQKQLESIQAFYTMQAFFQR